MFELGLGQAVGGCFLDHHQGAGAEFLDVAGKEERLADAMVSGDGAMWPAQELGCERGEKFAAAKKTRRANLVKAAEDWRFCCSLLEFVEQCERHWKSQSQLLTSAQLEWLAWAKQTVGTASTFPADFPDPTKDGGFDPSPIPFGGPYPTSRDLGE
ncbi:MAG TPA: hypothetical protein P5205_21475 [Candidatus Paceibacterota bacterium]|nr:hypothetical protein [Verrucomicrobiota bacterium]HSA12934.1 hypothetical protein [Candidatus Paceibacterota bacterium]